MDAFDRDLLSRICEALNLDFGPETVCRATTFFDGGLGIDSVDVLEVLSMVSREYGITIPDNKREEAFASFGALSDYVRAQVALVRPA